jgi:DNA-binding transcriptional MocR family regulator
MAATRRARELGRRTERRVLACARRLAARGRYPSFNRLATETGLARMTVSHAIGRLDARGRWHWSRGPGGWRYSDVVAALADELDERGLNYEEIARDVRERLGVPMSRSTVRYLLAQDFFADDPAEIARRAAEIRQEVAS